jgi:hypothetical protein
MRAWMGPSAVIRIVLSRRDASRELFVELGLPCLNLSVRTSG